MAGFKDKFILPESAFPEALTKYEYKEEDPIDEAAFKAIRKKWDPEKEKIVDKQIRAENFLEIEDKNGEKIKLEVRFLNPDAKEIADSSSAKEISNPKKTLGIISGWGSSYKRLSETAKVIAMEGNRPVVLLSMPGVGNSEDPPEAWIREKNFDLESDVALKTIEKIRLEHGDKKREVSLLGYSMGGIIAAQIAKDHPDVVKDLVLLHSAGAKTEPPVELATRFILNGGYEAAKKFGGFIKSGFDKRWLRSVEQHVKIGKKTVENILTLKRFKQHFGKEIDALAAGGIKDILKDVKVNLLTLSGSSEKLFPPQEAEELAQAAIGAKKRAVSVIKGETHTSPMLDHEIYGINIAHYLDEFEKEEKQ